MEYSLDIIDTKVDDHVLVMEHAEYSSLKLVWHGDDSKDVKNIMGSSFFFTLEAHISNNKDAMFSHLFTSDETHYQVRFYETDTDVTIWTGFLLPESYDEPYTNDTFYVRLEATDGLGRLKGKYLDDDFYTDRETSVVEIYAQCLALTGLELPILISPAIKNSKRDRYDDIYLPGSFFIEEEKRKSAYQVLEILSHDMLCRVCQVENTWRIEGFNQFHQTDVVFDTYDHLGVFVERGTIPRLIKNFKALGVPNVSIVSPYKSVSVSHKREQQSLPDTIGGEQNDGWAVGQGVDADIFPTHWFGNGGYYPKALAPQYKVTLPTAVSDAFDETKFVSLLRKIYVNQFDKLAFTLKLKSEVSGNQDDGSFIENSVRVTFKLNGEILYQVNDSFKDSELIFQFDLYANEAGLLDLEINEPYFNGNLQDGTFPQYLTIDEMKLERIDFVEEEIFSNEIDGEYSFEKEIPLNISDDVTGYSDAFRLQKLNEKSADFNSIQVDILYNRVFDGSNYLVLDLFNANLIADNLEGIYRSGAKVDDLEVFYNFLNGDEMSVSAPVEITDGSIEVRRFKLDDVNEDRKYWEQWSDTVFPIETDRYAVAVAKIIRRMFRAPFERVDFTSEDAFKINDLIRFDYVLPNNYFLTSVEWDIDRAQSTGTMMKSIYEGQITDVGQGNIPPIVNAGEDISVDFIGLQGVELLATAFDPDGFISSVSWEVIEGSGVSLINSDSLSPTVFPVVENIDGTITNLSELPLTLRVTVTDDDGASSFDDVVISEESEHVLSLNNTLNFLDYKQSSKKEVLQLVPELPDGSAIKIKGLYRIRTIANMFGAAAEMVCSLEIRKNGVLVFSKIINSDGEFISENGDFEFNYFKGDTVEFDLAHVFFVPAFGFAGNNGDLTPEMVDRELVYFEINNVTFQAGSGVVTGYPINKFVIDV